MELTGKSSLNLLRSKFGRVSSWFAGTKMESRCSWVLAALLVLPPVRDDGLGNAVAESGLRFRLWFVECDRFQNTQANFSIFYMLKFEEHVQPKCCMLLLKKKKKKNRVIKILA